MQEEEEKLEQTLLTQTSKLEGVSKRIGYPHRKSQQLMDNIRDKLSMSPTQHSVYSDLLLSYGHIKNQKFPG